MNLLFRFVGYFFRRINFGGVPRASGWSRLRNQFLEGKSCAVCGGTLLLNAHHILPFHLHPELELAVSNLLPLCEGNKNMNCHLQFGHFNNFATKWNVNIVEEAKVWRKRLLAKTIQEV